MMNILVVNLSHGDQESHILQQLTVIKFVKATKNCKGYKYKVISLHLKE